MSLTIDIFSEEQLNVLEIKTKWTKRDIEYFEETIRDAENIFEATVRKNSLANISLYGIFYQIDHLFNVAKLLCNEHNLRERYLNLILQYMPYIEQIKEDDYMYLEKKYSSLMDECFTNIPFLENYIKLI